MLCRVERVLGTRGAPRGPRYRSSAAPLYLAGAREGDRSQLRSWLLWCADQRRGLRFATRPLLALRARSDPVSRFRDEVCILQRAPSSLRSAGPPRLNDASPEGGLLRCSNPRLGVQIKDEVCVMQRPPFGCYASGRTPATHVATPGGGLLRCSSPRLGSLFAAQDELRDERGPQKPRKRLIPNPRRGLRRPAAGVRPSAKREKGGRCKTRTSSFATREGGTLHNTRSSFCSDHSVRRAPRTHHPLTR